MQETGREEAYIFLRSLYMSLGRKYADSSGTERKCKRLEFSSSRVKV